MPFALVLFLAFVPGAQDPTVIRIGNTRIGFQEFEERLNDIPLPNESLYSPVAVKEDLASTLVAETILASEAKKDNLDTLSAVRAMSAEYFREALYEQWMNEQVMDSIKVTPSEIQTGYNRFKQTRYIDYWALPSLKEALAVRQEIVEGIRKNTDGKLKKLEYGEAFENIEDTVYTMSVGQVSNPMKIGDQYYVFKLIKTEENPKYAKHDVGFYRPTIIERIRSKESTYRLMDAMKGLMSDKGYDIELESYKYLLRQLIPVVFDKDLPNADKGQAIQESLLETKLKSGKTNDKPLVVFKDGKVWTVNDVWRKLAVSPYPLNYPDAKALQAGVLQVIDRLVILDSVVKDAVARGYSDSHYVRYQTEMWSNSLLARAQLNKFRDSLPIKESVVRAFYDSTKKHHLQPERRRIIPLVVKSKALAERLYREIRKGADIVALARKYSVNKLGLDNKVQGVFITKNEWGNAGKAAFELRPGQVSAPHKIQDSTAATSYVIVKLLEVKKASPYPYKMIHRQLFLAYQNWLLHRYVNKFLLKAVKEYKISINQSVLASVPYAGGDMVVLKTHFPLRTGAPGIQFFDSPVRGDVILRPQMHELNSPTLAEYYRYAQTNWFHE